MKFEVDTGQLSRTVGELKETLTEISNNRAEMYKAIHALEGMWKGAAHDAFAVQFLADNTEMERLIREIDRTFTDMDLARKEYVECESKVVDAVNNISI